VVSAGAVQAIGGEVRVAAMRPSMSELIQSYAKENSLDWLGFIRPIRAFSMAYSDSK
jgi:hypothetical protein